MKTTKNDKKLVIYILTVAPDNKSVKLPSNKLSVKEMVESGLLESYAKEELNEAQMHELEMRLDIDLELGEQLEHIYIALEKSGWEP